MNRVDLVGRLTRDPELRHTTSGRAVCQISLAINRTFTNQNGEREADFINVVVWDKQAENVSKYVTKGRLVSVEGRLQSRSYDDKDGKKVYVTEVVAEEAYFADTKRDAETNPFATTGAVDAPFNPSAAPSEFTPVTDDDLPF